MFFRNEVPTLGSDRAMLKKYFSYILVAVMTTGCSNVNHVGSLVKEEFDAHSQSFKFVEQVRKADRVAKLENRSTSYAKNLKYGYFEEAYTYVQYRGGGKVAPIPASVAMHRIHSYKVLSRLVSDSGREARVVAAISYYDIDSGTLIEIIDEQSWWFAEVADRWFLENFTPIGSEMVQD